MLAKASPKPELAGRAVLEVVLAVRLSPRRRASVGQPPGSLTCWRGTARNLNATNQKTFPPFPLPVEPLLLRESREEGRSGRGLGLKWGHRLSQTAFGIWAAPLQLACTQCGAALGRRVRLFGCEF